MISELIREYNRLKVGKSSERPPFTIHDTENHYNIFINNTCSWMKRGDGCTMCSYSTRAGANAGRTVQNQINEIVGALQAINHPHDHCQIYMNGSFFCEDELSMKSRDTLIHHIISNLNVSSFKIETRPEYINKEKIEQILSLGIKRLEIAIGLETTDDTIRSKCINKGFSYSYFLQKVRSIAGLCEIKVYLLFKPPFISEGHAIEDTIHSVNRLVMDGFNQISITPLAVQAGTITEFLFQDHHYRPPWLWSLLEINSRLSNYRENGKNSIRVSGLNYYPMPLQAAFNCEKCSKEIYRALLSNCSLDWTSSPPKCSCIDNWHRTLKQEDHDNIDERISKAISSLNYAGKRSKSIYYSMVNASKRDAYLMKDVVKEVPSHPVQLDAVGIKKLGVNIQIMLRNIGDRTHFVALNCTGFVNATISLDEFHRGIHMSRLIAELLTFSNIEHYNVVEDIADLCGTISDGGKGHACDICFTLSTNYLTITRITKQPTTIPISIIVKSSIVNSNQTHITYSISIPIINACPCTLQMSEDLGKDQMTHTQRGILTVEATDTKIEFGELFRDLMLYTGPSSILKREDEIDLVSTIFKEPEFCEDLCRRVSISLSKKYKVSNSTGILAVSVETEESIHCHNAFCHKTVAL